MLLRPKLAGLFIALMASGTLLLSGCSSSSPRDLHYGTDADLFWVPPDATPTTATDDAAVDAGVSSDSATAVDGGTTETSIAASIDGDSQ
jgi:hypothetical protein